MFTGFHFYDLKTGRLESVIIFTFHIQIGIINDDSADNFAAHQYAPTESPFDANGKPFSDITAMFSANNGNQVSISILNFQCTTSNNIKFFVKEWWV